MTVRPEKKEMKLELSGATIELVRGDITLEETDVIVNAANSRLAGGGGVDGAIHRAGGPEIMAECNKISGKCPTGEAVITTGGRLKARYVIHTVGPVYRDGRLEDEKKLKNAYKNSLALASANGVKSIAFPSISTGVYGYPVEEAASVALRAVAEFAETDTVITLIRFVLFSDNDLKTYSSALKTLSPSL